MADWNELEFVSWREFKQMAPPIAQLEISRLGKVIDASGDDLELRNSLVQARFALLQFVHGVSQAEAAPVPPDCIAQLETARLALNHARPQAPAAAMPTLDYVLDRVRFLQQRCRMVY